MDEEEMIDVLEKKKEKLEEMREEYDRKEKEAGKLRNKIRNMERKLWNYGVLSQNTRTENVIAELQEEDKIFVEETGLGEDRAVDLYVLKDGKKRYLGRRRKEKRKSRRLRGKRSSRHAIQKFVEEEVEPVGSHSHEGIKHRIWRIEGDDLRVLKEFYRHRNLRQVYEEEGWEGIEYKWDLLEEYKDRHYPFSDREFEPGYQDPIRLREKILEYADKNDVTVKEAVAALKLEDENFAENYDLQKGKCRKQVKSIKRVFGPYLSSRGDRD